MSGATALLILVLCVGQIVAHAEMAQTGMGRLSVAMDIAAWLFCLIVQSVGAKKIEEDEEDDDE